MRSRQDTRRFDVSVRLAWEDDYLVAGVGLNGIDVATHRINVETVVELNVSFRTGDHTFRFCKRSVRRRIVKPVENAQPPVVVVHQDDFVEPSVDSDGAVNWVLVANRSDRRASDYAGLPGFLRACIHR